MTHADPSKADRRPESVCDHPSVRDDDKSALSSSLTPTSPPSRCPRLRRTLRTHFFAAGQAVFDHTGRPLRVVPTDSEIVHRMSPPHPAMTTQRCASSIRVPTAQRIPVAVLGICRRPVLRQSMSTTEDHMRPAASRRRSGRAWPGLEALALHRHGRRFSPAPVVEIQRDGRSRGHRRNSRALRGPRPKNSSGTGGIGWWSAWLSGVVLGRSPASAPVVARDSGGQFNTSGLRGLLHLPGLPGAGVGDVELSDAGYRNSGRAAASEACRVRVDTVVVMSTAPRGRSCAWWGGWSRLR